MGRMGRMGSDGKGRGQVKGGLAVKYVNGIYI